MNKKILAGLLALPMLLLGVQASAYFQDDMYFDNSADWGWEYDEQNYDDAEVWNWDDSENEDEDFNNEYDWGGSEYEDEDYYSDYELDEFEYDTSIDEVISERDWDTLSDKQIDDKLAAAGLEKVFDVSDPFYELTMAEIDNLSDEEWDMYGFDYDYSYTEEGEFDYDYAEQGEEDYDYDFGNSNNDSSEDVDVSYQVTAGETFTVVAGSEDAQARSVVTLLKAISPDSLSDKYLARLDLYTDAQTDEGASVVLNDDGTWDMAVNMDLLTEGGVKEMTETLVHEVAHILTLSTEQVVTQNGACTTYLLDEGCAKTGSFIATFYQDFWGGTYAADSIESEQAGYDRYDNRPSDFVTDYAATNPAEDLAETVATFVMNDKPASCDATVANKKVCSLYQHAELVQFRDSIRTNLSI